ncbi:hypothetical protein EGW08_002604 [Elysia chlorotica]|uniref:RING-type domain-containing protein n=1 Tax=Elysia chlorotica TaxID=188477 RepID=A0A433U6W8_ELYCH|nr:hypothetical protein EGW08_002604 [Elysia chlorotica]
MSNHNTVATETSEQQQKEEAVAAASENESASTSTVNLEGAMASNIRHPTGPLSNLNKETEMLDTLMQRMKSDLMYELRHLQHGERPVTGQGHRDSLHQFMLKHCDNPGQNNVTANRDSVEEHRPEAVVVEVQGIIEQRPVSSLLQSPAFRRQLENVIRGGLVSASTSRRTTGARATASASPAARHDLQQQQQQQQHSRRAANVAPSRPIRRSPRPVPQENALPQAPPRLSGRESEKNGNVCIIFSHHLIQYLFLGLLAAIENMICTFDARYAQRNQEKNLSTSLAPVLLLLYLLLCMTNIITSLLTTPALPTFSVLVHQEHVQSSGHNGQAVQEFIHTLPGRGIPQNDFSHLGIPGGAAGIDNDNWDNLSVTSLSAHSVPYVQTNTYLGREIQSLRAQMTEMKSLLKLNFDLQMDIQRSIRQEVAAALNNMAGASNSTMTPTGSRPVNDTHCLICLDRHSDTVLYQCGHMCVCYMCGRDLVARGHSCPVCRAPIKDVIRAYKTNAE